jgi:hypothetical protein
MIGSPRQSARAKFARAAQGLSSGAHFFLCIPALNAWRRAGRISSGVIAERFFGQAPEKWLASRVSSEPEFVLLFTFLAYVFAFIRYSARCNAIIIADVVQLVKSGLVASLFFYPVFLCNFYIVLLLWRQIKIIFPFFRGFFSLFSFIKI